jgi:ATP-dependent Clp protease adaptor protein ClpS
MPNVPDFDRDESVLTETETRLEKPKLYKVVLHNDDFTTQEFVVYILRQIFLRDEEEAFAIMWKVHTEGIGIAGIYTYEIATMKAGKAVNIARSHEYPFLCTVEEE